MKTARSSRRRTASRRVEAGPPLAGRPARWSPMPTRCLLIRPSRRGAIRSASAGTMRPPASGLYWWMEVISGFCLRRYGCLPGHEDSDMSAIMTYRRLTADQLLHLRQNPDTVLEWLAQEAESDSPGTNLSWDTDVMWHILHFVLNQEVWGGKKPLWNAVLGGKPFVPGVIVEDRPGHFLTDENAIWESARFLTRDEVKEIATALDAIETEWLRARF